jgi:hypothetical protein
MRAEGEVPRLALALTLVLLAGVACEQPRPPPPDSRSARQAPPSLPVDRLSADELQASSVVIFGLPVPVGMKVVARYPDAVHLEGRVSPEALANYVRKHISKTLVEIGAARTVYANVAIKGSAPGRVYRIDIGRRMLETTMSVEDITRPLAPVGLTPEQRWKEAGLTPQGKLLKPNQFD